MSRFELPDGPRDIMGGAKKFDLRQLLPKSAAVSGQRVGVTAPATGQMTFDWQDSINWWIPSQSFFVARGHFTLANGTALAKPTDASPSNIAYCDNWVATLWSQIQLFCNSQTVELLQNPAISDTALLYSSVDKTWLQSFGSGSGVGEGLMTRLWNSAYTGTGGASATNYNEVVATWRPALSMFDCCESVPPGAQWRIDLSFSSTAEQNIVESVNATKVAGSDYYFVLDEFTFYKASIEPAEGIPKPLGGFIELCPVQVNQYQINSSNSQFNIPLPATCTRMLVVFQDLNATNGFAAGTNTTKPVTSFQSFFSSGSTDPGVYLQNLYVSFPEISCQAPNPSYTFIAPGTGITSGQQKSGYERAYQDWCTVCRGSSGGYEGSVPFGTSDIGIGAAVLQPLATSGPVVQVGDPNNYQQNWAASATTATVAAGVGNATGRWGWMGRCPGPIFAFPVVRPPDRLISNATLNVTFTGAPTQVQATIIMSFTQGLACEMDASGHYQFEILRGL